MTRARVEDLGKISILIDEVLKNKFFEEEVFMVSEDKNRNEFLKNLSEGVDEIVKKLYLIKKIADGSDSD